jgi:hypothetical protein
MQIRAGVCEILSASVTNTKSNLLPSCPLSEELLHLNHTELVTVAATVAIGFNEQEDFQLTCRLAKPVIQLLPRVPVPSQYEPVDPDLSIRATVIPMLHDVLDRLVGLWPFTRL